VVLLRWVHSTTPYLMTVEMGFIHLSPVACPACTSVLFAACLLLNRHRIEAIAKTLRTNGLPLLECCQLLLNLGVLEELTRRLETSRKANIYF